MSIGSWWQSKRASDKFLIAYPLWFLLLFGLFYWGKYWDYSILGEWIDSLHREVIMVLLDAVLPNHIIGYEIVITPHYRIVITPECNGLVPYFIYLAAVLAYPCSTMRKLFWALLGYFVIMFANFVRLVAVTEVVNGFGAKSFYYAHDIGGNILLVVVGSMLFWFFLKGCSSAK